MGDERSNEPAVTCSEVFHIYDASTTPTVALRGVDFTIRQGSLVALRGPSGSGKSTLLRLLAGAELPTAGKITVAGTSVASLDIGPRTRFLRHRISYIFQHAPDNVLANLSVAQNIAVAARLRNGAARPYADEVESMPLLLAHRDTPAGSLSLGRQQCLSFVMATVGAPALVVADEPSSQMDDEEAHALLAAMQAMSAQGIASIFATHDPMFLDAVDRTIDMRRGRVAADHRRDEPTLARIDSGGWIPLPNDHTDRLPNNTATVDWSDDHYEVRPQ